MVSSDIAEKMAVSTVDAVARVHIGMQHLPRVCSFVTGVASRGLACAARDRSSNVPSAADVCNLAKVWTATSSYTLDSYSVR